MTVYDCEKYKNTRYKNTHYKNTSYKNTSYKNTRSINSMKNQSLSISAIDYSLLTDLYQLTMAACYVGEGVAQKRASFEMFVRRLPEGFGYLIAMGLAQALEYLENLSFNSSQIESLKETGIFNHAPKEFWELLQEAKFTGDVWAVAEGTAMFANEPFLRVEAPLWQGQLVETFLLNTLNYQTLIATRAARIRDIAGDDATLLEFGTRRAFSPQASLWAARAALAGGLNATSNVLAALQLGEKPSGTMAHALVMALSALEGSEDMAFTAFHRYFPGAPLLIDTYDSVTAAKGLAEKINKQKMELAGVRLDSGDLVSLSKEVHELLPGIPIFASGDLDEKEIYRLKSNGSCIEGYGLGTKLVTGAPVNGVYKLVEIDGIPVMKEASGKFTYPGRKQIQRAIASGKVTNDKLDLVGKDGLLELVMKEGKKLLPEETLNNIRQRTKASVLSLPDETRRLDNPQSVEVKISQPLQQLTEKTKRMA